MTRFTAPDGTTVDVITLSLTGGADQPGQHRDQQPGDGEQYLVRFANGILRGYARTTGELEALGVDVGSLTETGRNGKCEPSTTTSLTI